ncbi:MAG: hypothetical protein HQ522_13620, partial [Bacteroidetes bacterium]|nr:hypothetical protein [Bacteroidota bacterium]
MLSGKAKILTLLLSFFIFTNLSFAQTVDEKKNIEILEKGMEILKKYFYGENNWHVAEPSVGKDVKGLINFIDDEPVDSILGNLNNSFENEGRYVFRLQENVEDSLTVPGYYPYNLVQRDVERIGVQLQTEYQNKDIVIPIELTTNLDEKLNLIPEGKGMQLFTDSLFTIPDSLQIPDVIPDSLLNSPENFEVLRRTDSLRNVYIDKTRSSYNESLISEYVDSITLDIRTRQFEEEFSFQTKRLSDTVRSYNYSVLKAYNDSVINSVNDSILAVLKALVDYADYIDTTHISIVNLTGESTDIRLQNGNERFTRVWLKNEQNDSIGILVKNTDKRSVQMLIDDGVTFSRYKPKNTRTFDFNSLEKEISDFTKVGKSYEIETPWRIDGDGNAGFTQTYLENWKKGGQSAL